MDLDFSKIDSIGSPQKPASEPKEVNHSKPLKTDKTPVEGKIEPHTQALQRKADNRHKQLEDSARVLKEYQQSKKLTNELVTEITKGLQQGIDIYDLFLKAIEALALATNDTALHKRTRDNLKTIYGIGLKETRAVELEKEDTQKRLERLIESLEETSDISDQLRLKRAIQAHKKRLEALQE
uniref:Uncharacterized protein n=1 Tax=Streptococcus thermophilus TaxID=1308 RepID=Q2MM23_STRTR|nr:hypothetical protein [Streptococcus thermophilus]ABC55706.1 hypothetical protein [Streptococcus thermophilus]